MRRLYYSSGSVLTADVTAKAVLRYARALAIADRSDIVEVPVITEGGSRAHAHLLIGPASQLFTTPVPDSIDAPVDEEELERMERDTLRLSPARPAWPDEMADTPAEDYIDMLYGIELDRDDAHPTT
jgi:hypothetical protein